MWCSFDEFEEFYEQKAKEAAEYAATQGEDFVNHMKLVPPSLLQPPAEPRGARAKVLRTSKARTGRPRSTSASSLGPGCVRGRAEEVD